MGGRRESVGINTWPRPRRRGFVLPLTLWIIALVGLAVAAVNTWVSAALENSRILQRRAETDIAVANFRNELIYALAIRPMTYRGLEVGSGMTRPNRSDFDAVLAADYNSSEAVALDGRPYQMANQPDFIVQLQDSRGLVNLNTVTAPYLRRFLSVFNVPEPLQGRLTDTLLDWIDEDNDTRQAGAEADAYQQLGRVQPSNASLLTPLEAQSVLGWDSVPQIWEADQRSPLFTACGQSGFNPNTAPEAVLMAYIIGLTHDNEVQVLEKRAQTPFRNSVEFGAAANVITPNDAFFFSFVPGQCVTVDVTDRTSNERTRFSLSIRPFNRLQPWQVDYAYKIPSRFHDAVEHTTPQDTFPTPETLSLRESDNNGAAGVKQAQ